LENLIKVEFIFLYKMRGLIEYGLMAVLSLGCVGANAGEGEVFVEDAEIDISYAQPIREQLAEERRALFEEQELQKMRERDLATKVSVLEHSIEDDYAILVDKTQALLYLYQEGTVLKKYKVDLGEPGDKNVEGDGRTPEGLFYTSAFINYSRFGEGLAMLISYPNLEDAQRGIRDGLITESEFQRIKRAIDDESIPPGDTNLGGQIEIHGAGTGGKFDWTVGCMAITNEDMKELWNEVAQREVWIGILAGY